MLVALQMPVMVPRILRDLVTRLEQGLRFGPGVTLPYSAWRQRLEQVSASDRFGTNLVWHDTQTRRLMGEARKPVMLCPMVIKTRSRPCPKHRTLQLPWLVSISARTLSTSWP